MVRTGGASIDDQFSGAGNLATMTAASGNVVLSGTTIGTYIQSAGTLVITFNSSASTTFVQETLRSITYRNNIVNPGSLNYDQVSITFTFNDQNSNTTSGGSAGTGQDQGNGGFATVSGTIILPINRLPVSTSNTNSLSEGISTAAISATLGNVLTDGTLDSDQDSETLSVAGVSAGTVAGPLLTNTGSSVRGAYGNLNVASDGSYTYTLDNALDAVQRLAVGESITDTFSYTVTDTRAGRTTSTLTITINGTNDVPRIITSSGDQVQLTSGTSTPTIRIAIPSTGVVAGNTVRLTYLAQSQTPVTLTTADITRGYIDVQLTVPLQDAQGSLASVPVKWIDWTSSTTTTVTGTITTESGTVGATLTSAAGFSLFKLMAESIIFIRLPLM